MQKNKTKSTPKFSSLDELVSFFENNDLGEYRDNMPEVHFDINIKKSTHIFSLDEDLAETLAKIARTKQIPTRTLVNAWLREKVVKQAGAN